MPSGRTRWVALGALGVILAGVLTWALWPDPEPRQREYLDATACLLTDERGIAGEQARPVWAAMQDASVSSLVKVQFLEVMGPQTADNARTFVASLAGGKCGVVIAVGKPQIDAVTAAAKTYPNVRFVTVGGSATAANVTAVDDADAGALRAEITKQVTALVPAVPADS
ncbi:hypothetical protein GCM10009681_38670 [Luedemannella helvata]|uniref:BMP family ABC transporter substrate-binding protein n=1 Tax=Luedemannella helvata TaxID=349315 RepID=A0ABP4WV98_9ACTN